MIFLSCLLHQHQARTIANGRFRGGDDAVTGLGAFGNLHITVVHPPHDIHQFCPTILNPKELPTTAIKVTNLFFQVFKKITNNHNRQ